MAKVMDVSSDASQHGGAYSQALADILRRISPRWGQHIDVEPGWYPLIIEVDRKLSNVDPNYKVQQIKQKFGTLRYYCWPSGDEPSPTALVAFETITDEAERVSAAICERCGAAGASLRHQADGLHVRTLCNSCADTLNYQRSQ